MRVQLRRRDGLRAAAGVLLLLVLVPDCASYGVSAESGGVPSTERLARSNPAFVRVPVAEFAERLFGEVLGFDVVVAPGVRALTDPVDLRLEGKVSPEQLYRIGQRVLAARGVVVSVEGAARVFTLADPSRARLPPQPLDGRGTDPGRDVFVQVPLQVVTPVRVGVWLAETLAAPGFNVDEDTIGNSVLLSGPPAVVEDALRMVRVLDQPRAAARHGLRITPRHIPSDRMATELVSVLQSEGIAADPRSPVSTVMVVPLSTQNTVAVFAARQGLIDHAAEWARAIDLPPSVSDMESVFSWPLEHQQAMVVVEALQPLLREERSGLSGGAIVAPQISDAPEVGEGEEDVPDEDGGIGSQSGNAPLPAKRPPALVADTHRNAVVFRGTAAQWRRLGPQIRAMDVPAPSVLVDVFVIEVSLGRQFASGLEWLASGGVGGERISFGSRGLAPGEEGFKLLLRDGETVRAALGLTESDSRAALRARPRLLVVSGHEARLDVGDDVPVLASSARSTRRADAPLVDRVEYRRTGLSLAVRPTVSGDGRLDLEVSQEVASARRTASSGIDSPTIRSRRLQTTVSLRDGGAVLLGGLTESVSSGTQAGGARLPAPLDLPDARQRDADRTELLVLIRPRVLQTPEDAAGVTAASAP